MSYHQYSHTNNYPYSPSSPDPYLDNPWASTFPPSPSAPTQQQPFPPPSPSHAQFQPGFQPGRFPSPHPAPPGPPHSPGIVSPPGGGAPPPIPARPVPNGPSTPITFGGSTWDPPWLWSAQQQPPPHPEIRLTHPTPPIQQSHPHTHYSHSHSVSPDPPHPPPRSPRVGQGSYPPPLPPRSPRTGQGSFPPYSPHVYTQGAASSSVQHGAPFQSPELQQSPFSPSSSSGYATSTWPTASYNSFGPQPARSPGPRPLPLLPEHSSPPRSPPQTTGPPTSPPRHGSTSFPAVPAAESMPHSVDRPSPTGSAPSSPPLTDRRRSNENTTHLAANPIPLSPSAGSASGTVPLRSSLSQSSSPSPSSPRRTSAGTPIRPAQAGAAPSGASSTSTMPSSTAPQAGPSASFGRVVPLAEDLKRIWNYYDFPQTSMQGAQAPAAQSRPSMISPSAAEGDAQPEENQPEERQNRPAASGTVPQAAQTAPTSSVRQASQPPSNMSDMLEGLINDMDELEVEPPPTYIAALAQPSDSPGSTSTVTPVSARAIMNRLNTQPEPPRPFELVIDRPVPIPKVGIDDPADIVYICPGFNVTRTYPLTWYHLRGGDDEFLMCSKCHHDFVADTPYADDFVRLARHRGGMCSYAIPKAAYKLLPEAKRTLDGTALKAWATERADKRHCVADVIITPADNVKAFVAKNAAINDFALCAECMDDIVSVTPFADKFQEMPAGPPWMCDGPVDTSRLQLLRAGTIGPEAWDSLCANLNRAQQLPPCNREHIASTQFEWYTPSRPIHGFACCERCYRDIVKASPFASKFVKHRPAPGEVWSCDFSLVTLQHAFEIAVDHGNFDIWWTAASTIVDKAEDLKARPDLPVNMWGLADSPAFVFWGEGCNSSFSVCVNCYAGHVTPLRLEKFFRPRVRGSGHKCSLCKEPSTAVRYPFYQEKLSQALDWGIWTPFFEAAFSLGSVPPCSGRDLVSPGGRRWWGWRPSLQICEECYWTFARDKWAERYFDYNGAATTGDKLNICTLYSPLMRAKYRDACERKDLTHLLEFAEERGHAYVNYYLPMKNLLRLLDYGTYRPMSNMGTMSTMGMTTMGTMDSDSATMTTLIPATTQREYSIPTRPRQGSLTDQIAFLEQEWAKFE